MDATQTTETRTTTILRLNGDELHHLCTMAQLRANQGGEDGLSCAIAVEGWINRCDKPGWLAEWYIRWEQKQREMLRQNPLPKGTVPGPGPDIEVDATLELDLLCNFAANERQLQDVPKCGLLHDKLWKLALVTVCDPYLDAPDDDAPPKTGYHIATDSEVKASGRRQFNGQSRNESIAQVLWKWLFRHDFGSHYLSSIGAGNIQALANPDGEVFALVIGDAEARLMVDALNTWS